MDSAKSQLITKLQEANNILVTVSRNPSVDQLSACLGLTLMLNKMGKHAAAVFSGEVPSTIEFLAPEETLEKNTDSLRDFIIALDKSKADKLRYKVEDNIVKIFITPYKTSISQDDLEFSEGDFNVDVVVALGVHQQDELDEAITAHGRILHDATVSSINTSLDGALGSINWNDDKASSLSELVTEIAQALNDNVLDQQIATALLTGIVAETDRFSNDKTSSQTMSASAALMNAGANQQLVASKLEEPEVKRENQDNFEGNDDGEQKNDDGLLEIEHVDDDKPKDEAPVAEEPSPEPPQPPVDDQPAPPGSPEPHTPETPEPAPPEPPKPDNEFEHKPVTEPPALGGTLTANSRPEDLDPVTDPFSMPASENPQLLDHSQPANAANTSISPPPAGWTPPEPQPAPAPPASQPLDSQPAAPTPVPPAPNSGSLTTLEASVKSPHLDTQKLSDLDAMRAEVNSAINTGPVGNEPPIESLNAQPLGGELHSDQPQPPAPVDNQQPMVTNPSAPPPVPPPIPFQFGNPGNQQNQQ